MKNKMTFKLVLILAVSSLFITAANQPEPQKLLGNPTLNPSWVIECVDCPKNFSVRYDHALRVDSSQHRHIAYGGDHLYYAWEDGVTWRLDTVDASPGVGAGASLALDSTGKPDISYYDSLNGDLKYTHWTGSAWQVQTVDGGADDVGSSTSLALSGDTPHIAYYDKTHNAIKYAGLASGGTWTISTVALVGEDGGFSLAWSSHLNIPFISYYNGLDHSLWIATVTNHAWSTNLVDAPVGPDFLEVGRGSSLMMGPALGNPVSGWSITYTISYYANGSEEVKVAHYDQYAAHWTFTIIDPAAGGGSGNTARTAQSIYCGTDHPTFYVVYGNGYNPLKYATWGDLSWNIHEIASTDGALEPSIDKGNCIDSPQISYFDPNTHALELMDTGGQNAWKIQSIDQGQLDVGQYTSLALDKNGRPHISYYSPTNHSLRYAYKPGTTWNAGFVTDQNNPDPIGIRWDTSLAVDSTNHPFIAYEDGSLGLSKLQNGLWSSETVDLVTGPEAEAEVVSLALDKSDKAHIAYYFYGRPGQWGLEYAEQSGSAWNKHVIDGNGGYGFSPALAMDGFEDPRIVYPGDSGLKYATRTLGVWSVQTIGGYWKYPSLAIDSLNRSQISFTDAQDHLSYGRLDGSTWTIVTVDSSGEGRYSSIALDKNNNPHISYYDPVNGDLKYAYLLAGKWTIETVDSAGDVGAFTSLALDKDGYPHISYYDRSDGDLKYAYLTAPVTSNLFFYLPVVRK